MDPWSVGNRCGWLSSDKRVGHSVRAAVVLDVQSLMWFQIYRGKPQLGDL